MRVFRTKSFERFARRNRISDQSLCDVAQRVVRSESVADLGGGVFKCRFARPGRGKSSGFRFVILYRKEERLVFAHGFAKNKMANTSPEEDVVLRMLARELLYASEPQIETACTTGFLAEVSCVG